MAQAATLDDVVDRLDIVIQAQDTTISYFISTGIGVGFILGLLCVWFIFTFLGKGTLSEFEN